MATSNLSAQMEIEPCLEHQTPKISSLESNLNPQEK